MGAQTSKFEEVSDGLMLRVAAREGHEEVVQMYMQKNAALTMSVSKADGSSAVSAACEGGQASILQLLLATLRVSSLSNTFDPAKQLLDHTDSRGMTALATAAAASPCGTGHIACTRILLQAGCSLLPQDQAGRSCLHYAALAGNSQLVELLLLAATDQQQQQQQHVHGELEHSPAYDHGGVLHRFANLRDAAGRTALHYAVRSGDLQTLHLLIRAGARLTPAAAYDCLDDVPVNKGATPLHLAAIKGDTPSAVLLLTAYLTAAAGALPEVAPSCCTCGGSDDDAGGDARCEGCAGRAGGSNSSSCRRAQLRDPRTVEDWYGLTPFVLADSDAQGVGLKQLLDPNADITAQLQALPTGRPGSHDVAAAAGVGSTYKQLVRSLSNAGKYLARQSSLQEAAKTPQQQQQQQLPSEAIPEPSVAVTAATDLAAAAAVSPAQTLC